MKRLLFDEKGEMAAAGWPRRASHVSIFCFISMLAGCAQTEETLLPTIAILEPTNGAIVCGDPIRLVLQIENYDLEEPGSSTEKGTARHEPTHEDEISGHVDVYLDGVTVAMEGKTEIDISGVADGEHQLNAELVDEEHESLIPAISDVVYFTVDNALCDAT